MISKEIGNNEDLQRLKPEKMDNNVIRLLRKYIREQKLNTKSNLRERVYKRAYVCAYLRATTTLSLDKIGDFIGKDHSMVLHYINNVHLKFVELDDDVYYSYIRDLVDKFPIGDSLTTEDRR